MKYFSFIWFDHENSLFPFPDPVKLWMSAVREFQGMKGLLSEIESLVGEMIGERYRHIR